MRGAGRRDRLPRASPYVVAGLVALLLSISVWPGYMSFDSVYMLRQVRTGISDNTHSVLMMLIWRMLDRLYPGPALILLLHAAVFFLALAHLLGLYAPRRLWVVLILPLVALTPVLGPLLVVWKDVGMLACFTAACAALAHAEKHPGRKPLLLALACLVMATAYRHDAPAPALPLFLWWSWLAARRLTPGRPLAWLRVGLVFVSAFAATLAATRLLDRWASPSTTGLASAALLDLIGTSHYAGVNLLPPETFAQHESFGQADVDRIYVLDCVNHAFLPTWLNADWKLLTLPSAESMQGAWVDAVRFHAPSYLRHRLAFALNFTALTRDSVYFPSHLGVEPNELGVASRPNLLTPVVRRWVLAASSSLWWKPWLYYAAGAALAAALLATRTPGRHVPLLIYASGYAHLFAASLVMACADMRYQLWSLASMIAASAIAVMLMRSALAPATLYRNAPD